MTISVLLALAIYGAAAAASIALARRWVAAVSRRAALLLVLLPLAFTGRALVTGRLYGPADLYAPHPPWRAAAEARGIGAPANPILSDLAFANIPWRAAVRESVVNGRLPFWNRFVLAGNPLLASAQAGIFHPSTWLALPLPLAVSWTLSCTLTIFLALLAAFLCFRGWGLGEAAAALGAVGWGFSTYLIFWAGWSVGPSTAAFPLLALGARRLAREEPRGAAITVAALLLAITGGHPESAFHTTAAAAAVFAGELIARARASRERLLRPLANGLAAGGIAFLLAGPQLLPLLAAIPHSAEYRQRSLRLAAGAARQSVPVREAGGRLLPALLPYAHGIYGRSPVQEERGDGSGMPLAYAGSLLFPFALLGLFSRRRGSITFAVAAAAGLLLGASAPGLIDLLTRLPGFALALNYRLVFLAPFGLAGLAALGLEETIADGARGRGRLILAALGCFAAVGLAGALARPLYRERALPADFVGSALLAEIVPLGALVVAAAIASARRDARFLSASAVVLLLFQRAAEMGGVYPTLDATWLTVSDPALEAVRSPEGPRVAAIGFDLRPNGSTLLGLEDVRGYESIVLDRFAETFPLWCEPQAASFNRVDDLTRPFLAFLGARFAVAGPDAVPPAGWTVRSRSSACALFENPRALKRAFVPRRVESVPEPLAALAAAGDFSETVWVEGAGRASSVENGRARLETRESGPDLVLEVDASSPCLVATSLPDWPGWRTVPEIGLPAGGAELVTVNHAFVGVRVPSGHSRLRLVYRPPGFAEGVAAFVIGGCLALLAISRRK